jgi:MFS family permease
MSLGVYQAFYTTTLIPNESQARIGWISAMAFAMSFFGAVVAGPLVDAGHLKPVLTAGVVLTCFGLMMTSLCNEYFQLLLAQGVVMGFGCGLLLLPSMSIPVVWFPSPKGLAIVFTLTGIATSIGGLIYSAMFHYIERESGWRWAVRATGFVSLGTSSAGAMMLRYKQPVSQRRKFFNLSMWNEPGFKGVLLAAFFAWGWAFTPMNWLEGYYLHEQHIRHSDVQFWLVPIAFAGGIPGM